MRQNREHQSYWDFSGFVFPIVMEFGNMIFPKVYFGKAEFIKEVQFTQDRFKFAGQGGTQKGCEFRDSVDFSEAKFMDVVDFFNAEFWGTCNFYKAEFVNDAHFTGVVFTGNLNFSRVKTNYVTFGNAYFTDESNFHDTEFRGETSFNGAVFSSRANFRNVEFWDDSYFNNITFESEVNFEACTFITCGFAYTLFKGLTFLTNIIVNGNIFLHNNEIHSRFYLNVKEWKKLHFPPSRDDFKYTGMVQVRDPIFLNKGKMIISGSLGEITEHKIVGLSLQYCDLDNISLIDVNWPKISKRGRKASIDELILELGQDRFGPDLTIGTSDSVSQLYRSLREKYEREKRYHDAGDFFRGEMDIRRKYSESRTDKILLTFYNWLSRYGESIGLPFLWSFLFIILSSVTLSIVQFKSHTLTDLFIDSICLTLPTVLMAFFPLSTVNEFYLFLIKLVGTLLIGTIFIAVKRKMERK